MSKGNQVAEPVIKETKIPDFDTVFEEAKEPLGDAAGWNNELDDKLQEFRGIGRELREYSKAEAPPVIGELTLHVENGEKVTFTITKNGAEVDNKALGALKTYKAMCEKKCGKVLARLKTLRKLEGCENAVYDLDEKNPHKVVLKMDSSAKEQHKEADAMLDLNRSLMKLNDRLSILDENLKGPITIAETISGLFQSMKDELKKKGAELKVAIEDGFPKIQGLPDSIEDAVPELIARAWQLFTGILDFLKQLLSDIPGLVEKIQNLFKTASEFPGKMKEAASGLNMGPSELLKTAKIIKNNVNALKSAPQILAALSLTCQDTLLQITTAIQGTVNRPEN